jgi:hypothetical protein
MHKAVKSRGADLLGRLESGISSQMNLLRPRRSLSDHRAQRHPDRGRSAFGDAKIQNPMLGQHVYLGNMIVSVIDKGRIEHVGLGIQAIIEIVDDARACETGTIPAIAIQ